MEAMANVDTSEINQAVGLIWHAYKSKKEIFLHLLFCLAARGMDNLLYRSALQPMNFSFPERPFIRVVPNKFNKTLTIIDNGSGLIMKDLLYYMSNDALTRTAHQIDCIEDNVTLIDSTDLGLFFAYLVADKVVVRTKHDHHDQYVWEWQAGDDSFILTRDTSEYILHRGTRITLYLNEDQLEYLEVERLKELIRKHSSVIRCPIYLSFTETSELETAVGGRASYRRFPGGPSLPPHHKYLPPPGTGYKNQAQLTLVSYLRAKFSHYKEIFLHLLINASVYALDRLRCDSTQRPSDYIFPKSPSIRIVVNKTNKTLTIIDNGSGMTKAELLSNTGDKAIWDTLEMIESVPTGEDVKMIIQSGFGLYFAFLVADKVVFRTKHKYDQLCVWEWQVPGRSTVYTCCEDNLVCGSSMTLYLKEDELEYLDKRRLKKVIRKHSKLSKLGYYPILLEASKPSEVEIPVGGRTSYSVFPGRPSLPPHENPPSPGTGCGSVYVNQAEIMLVSYIRTTFKSYKEIFLHLLINNSAYALDRLQYESTVLPSVHTFPKKPFIRIVPNKTDKKLIIYDNGAGMTKADLLSYTDYSAMSDTINMIESVAAAGDISRIARSGFGLYFAFLVADKVVFRTKHKHGKPCVWRWQIGGPLTKPKFTACKNNRDCWSRMTLYLKEDALEYLDDRRLEELIGKHSEVSKLNPFRKVIRKHSKSKLERYPILIKRNRIV